MIPGLSCLNLRSLYRSLLLLLAAVHFNIIRLPSGQSQDHLDARVNLRPRRWEPETIPAHPYCWFLSFLFFKRPMQAICYSFLTKLTIGQEPVNSRSFLTPWYILCRQILLYLWLISSSPYNHITKDDREPLTLLPPLCQCWDYMLAHHTRFTQCRGLKSWLKGNLIGTSLAGLCLWNWLDCWLYFIDCNNYFLL